MKKVNIYLSDFQKELEDYSDYYDYIDNIIKTELIQHANQSLNVDYSERNGNFFEYTLKNTEEEYELHLHFRELRNLNIKIFDKSEVTDYNHTLEEIKLWLKDKLLAADFKHCLWLEDEQSNELSLELYNKVHKIENKLRQLINLVLFTKLDNWWEFVPDKLQNQHKGHQGSAIKVAKGFRNVSHYLLALYAEDLGKLLKHEYKEWCPSADEEIAKLLRKNSPSETANSIHDKLKKQLVTKINFWEQYFKNYLSGDFLSRWETEFRIYRNHIAHNKLVDYKGFEVMNSFFDNLIIDLDNALSKVEEELDSVDFSTMTSELNDMFSYIDE
ncbi:hypothetical protein AB4Z45_21795 [Paenibacillus sp. MCAF9]|uniref:hypothetical protein n=1 Tax=Paenibacillus sp. MCAF9 TaxID=3233046 RepID=UPI003F9BE29E